MTELPLMDSSFAVPVFSPGDDPIAYLNKVMDFIIVVASLRFPSTNNQHRTSPNPRNQAIIQHGRVIVQQVHGRQGQSYFGTGYKSNATSSGGNKASEHARITEDLDTYDFDCDDILNAQAFLMANTSNYDSDVILEVPHSATYLNDMENQSMDAMQDFEQTPVMDFSDNEIHSESNIIIREKMIDSLRDDMIREKLALKELVDSLEQNLVKQIKEKECLLQTFTVFKNESKEKEYNIIFKVGQSAQTVHMLTKPQAFYDNIHKQALGYQNPFHLKKAQRIKPTLYDGIVMSDKHVPMPVINNEETLILEEKSQSKLYEKAKDPEIINKNISHKPIDYKNLNRLSKDFGKCFTPQQEMDVEQALWLRISNPTSKPSDVSPVKIEEPKELPKIRTTPDARTEGEWGFEHTKAIFNNEIIPFLKSLKDIFNVFDRDLLNEIMEVFKEHFESIKKTRVCSKEQSDSLIDKLNLKSAENEDLKAQIQDKVFVITSLKNDLRKIKGKEIVGLKCSTSKCGSKPTGNKRNDRISQTPNRNMKNKVEAQPSKVIKKNHVVEPICDDNVKHSKSNANSDFNCAVCKKSLFDDVHDKCHLDFVKTVNSRAKSAKKHKKIGDLWVMITLANVVPPKNTTSHSVETQKPELNVYSRKPKNVKNVVQIVLWLLYFSWYWTPNVPKHMTGNRSQLIELVRQRLRAGYGTVGYHISFRGTLNKLARDGLAQGIPRLQFQKDHLCSACALGKSKKSSHQPKAKDTNQEKLYLLHMDLCGPMRMTSINGKRHFVNFMKMLASRIKHLLPALLSKMALLKGETCRRYNKTPYELMQDKKADLLFFHVFGALYYPTNDNDNLGKLDAKADIDDWDHLFQPMFDEYFTPPPISVTPVQEVAALRAVDLADSPVSTFID
ncbi:hypothetical protein Tco_1003728 [Tanacetum coccineum]|uniref:Uncharacterized protein n=1 Tax=Tanacetum coccineum TaxID=301880 RepID=A0ABQ5FBA9_9ASTR